MDVFLNYLNNRMADVRRQGQAVSPMELALLLREGMKYSPGNPVLLTELACLMAGQGLAWEAYRLARLAHGLDGNARAASVINLVENPPLPQEITFETTTVCNLKCPLCENGAGQMTTARQHMPYETFAAVWEKLRPTTKRLILVGYGETFLHPDVYRILGCVKGTPYVYIDTNGNVDLDCERVIRAGVTDFTFSVDGINQEMYARYRRGGNLERVLRNVRALVAAKRRLGAARPTITFKFIVFKHTEMYVEEAKRLAAELGVDQFRLEPCTFKPCFGEEAFRQFMPLSPDHQRIDYVDFEKGEVGCPPHRDSRHCSVPMGSAMVTVEGELTACCGTNHVTSFGNLITQSYEEVWRSPEYARFRLKVMANRHAEPVCRVCSRELHSLGRFFEGTELAEAVPPPQSEPVAGRCYLKDNRVSAAEMAELVAAGRTKEAAYFASIGKAESTAPEVAAAQMGAASAPVADAPIASAPIS